MNTFAQVMRVKSPSGKKYSVEFGDKIMIMDETKSVVKELEKGVEPLEAIKNLENGNTSNRTI